MNTIATLRIGETGVISHKASDNISLKLLEMGCLPGSRVKLLQIAPLKDPLYISVNGSYISIRRETASKIAIDKL